MNTLENAGFSRANPYYYVAQGKARARTSLPSRGDLSVLSPKAFSLQLRSAPPSPPLLPALSPSSALLRSESS